MEMLRCLHGKSGVPKSGPDGMSGNRNRAGEGFPGGESPQEEESSGALPLLTAKQGGGGSGKGPGGAARNGGRTSAEGGASEAEGGKEDAEF